VCCRNTADRDAGVPARGLNGEAYRGHVFWDELYVYPFLNFRMPEVTRELLLYRYRRLGEARAAAREAGSRGALSTRRRGSGGPRWAVCATTPTPTSWWHGCAAWFTTFSCGCRRRGSRRCATSSVLTTRSCGRGRK